MKRTIAFIMALCPVYGGELGLLSLSQEGEYRLSFMGPEGDISMEAPLCAMLTFRPDA